jgi:hypothetical protein
MSTALKTFKIMANSGFADHPVSRFSADDPVVMDGLYRYYHPNPYQNIIAEYYFITILA